MIDSPFLNTFKPVFIVTGVLIIAHLALLFFVLPPVYLKSYFWAIYLFLFPLTFLALYVIIKKYLSDKRSAGKNFMIYVVVKMILSLTFLSPVLYYKTDISAPFVYQFFLFFFPLLFIETFVLVRLINSEE